MMVTGDWTNPYESVRERIAYMLFALRLDGTYEVLLAMRSCILLFPHTEWKRTRMILGAIPFFASSSDMERGIACPVGSERRSAPLPSFLVELDLALAVSIRAQPRLLHAYA